MGIKQWTMLSVKAEKMMEVLKLILEVDVS